MSIVDRNDLYMDIDVTIQPKEMIGQGNTAEIYQIDNNKIVKIYRSGFSKYAIEKEYQNSIVAMNNLEFVPKIYGRISMGDREGIVFQQIDGVDMLKKMSTDLRTIRYYSKMFAKYHSQVGCPISDEIQTVKDKLKHDIEWEKNLSDKEKREILEYMEHLPDGNELCHLDFHPGNVMLSCDGGYLIDWMNACKGDACADIARTSILLTYGEVIYASKYQKLMYSLIKYLTYKTYIKEYLKISGKRMEDIRKWELPVAAARLNETLTNHERQKLICLVKKLLNE